MRKAISIFFLLIFLVFVTEAGQLLKLPVLVHHYLKHRQGENGLSFADFLKTHYLQDHKDDGDKKQDRQLPFKTMNPENSCTSFLQPEPPSIQASGLPVSRVLSTYLPECYLSGKPSGIFRPPRTV
jgi:hypothetical protein